MDFRFGRRLASHKALEGDLGKHESASLLIPGRMRDGTMCLRSTTEQSENDVIYRAMDVIYRALDEQR
jgi:hypothetical protein